MTWYGGRPLRAALHNFTDAAARINLMEEPRESAVHCCACRRLIGLPEGAKEGDTMTCPFCAAKMVLRLMTVFIAEEVVEA
ncbi:hypothetical protein IIA79_08255 [bacterium]|nr:hypothetical protein [bacterium]